MNIYNQKDELIANFEGPVPQLDSTLVIHHRDLDEETYYKVVGLTYHNKGSPGYLSVKVTVKEVKRKK